MSGAEGKAEQPKAPLSYQGLCTYQRPFWPFNTHTCGPQALFPIKALLKQITLLDSQYQFSHSGEYQGSTLTFIPCSLHEGSTKILQMVLFLTDTLKDTHTKSCFSSVSPLCHKKTGVSPVHLNKFWLCRLIVALGKLHHQCFHSIIDCLIVFMVAPIFLLLLFAIPNWSLTFLVHNQLLRLPRLRRSGF